MNSTIVPGSPVSAMLRHPFIGIIACNILLGNVWTTVEECELLCGVGSYPYEMWEVINAVTTWMLPLFVLVGNVQFSTFQLEASWRRGGGWAWVRDAVLSHIFIACHLLGNPIDYIWSHLERLQDMRQTRLQAEGDYNRPIICIALQDFDSEDIGNIRAALENQLDATVGSRKQAKRRARLLAACQHSAFLLAHTRISSTRRSAVAVIAYSVALFTSLSSAMAQNPLPVHTPHTLALRELYYWLIMAVAVSSSTGAFPTEYTEWAALKPVIDVVKKRKTTLGRVVSLEGGSYGHRPQKKMNRESFPRLTVAMLSVGVAWVFSFIMSWITPTQGLGCRNFVEIGYLCTWIVNFFFSYFIQQMAKHKWPWWVLASDVIVAVPSILCLFLAWQGWFNSCKCWGAFWTLRQAQHHDPSSLAEQELQLKPWYFGLIAAALCLQGLISVGVLLFYGEELRLIYGRSEGFLQYMARSSPSKDQSEKVYPVNENEQRQERQSVDVQQLETANEGSRLMEPV
ncbi:hypothetical protein NA57DRAFT_79866 [Rhizodiscina lignyota]|uniref:Uncharacterized protein n=1 Tax=Rhizodiscina lignyota TaxID=1504668 RepID=A0A9P4I6C1_9PEZI|nr:hypothetical protein NA57DRAFT_79866 [Rhizodiscina lignyota]